MRKNFKDLFKVLIPILVVFTLVFSSIYVFGFDTDVDNTVNFTTDVIYHIVTDRFLDGDSSNNPSGTIFDTNDPRKYHGGDWQGIIDKIKDGYLTNLGVTALWISQPVENITIMDPSNNTAAYHGYWARDFFEPNSYFGSESDFSELVSTAHANDIKIIIDFVPNHTSTCEYTGYTFPEDGALYRDGTLVGTFSNDTNGIFNHESWSDFSTLENGIYHSLYGLGDLNQLNSTIDNYMKDAIGHWLDKGVDGIRMDAVKHMPLGWQKNWLSSIYKVNPVFVFGEWYHGNTSADSDMTNFANNSGMSLLDFRFANAVRNVIGSGSDSMTDLYSVITQTDSDYDEVNNQVIFIDNHDLSRFYTLSSLNQTKVNQAYTILLTSRGIPTIYYGSEQYLEGSSDPDNRRDMPSFSTSTTAFEVISKLAPLRKSNPALAYGSTQERWINSDVLIYEREFGESVVLTAVNRNQSSSYSITGLYTSLPVGIYSDVLEGILNGNNINVSSSGAVTSFTLGAGACAVWEYSNGASTPMIGNVGPTMGVAGNTITIDGRGFSTTAGSVLFGTTAGIVQSWSDNQIKVQIPSISAGTYDVYVENSSGVSSDAFDNFEILTGDQVCVRFMVNNAYTDSGTNVYLTGSVSELGNWDLDNAVGPLFNNTDTIGTYPTWFYDVNVPAGSTIEYKFIKIDGSGNVTWESGSNHSVTTPSTGTSTVTVYWQ